MGHVKYAINMARQHVEIAKKSIENGIEDLIDYSIRAAEKWLKQAEDRLKEQNDATKQT